MHPHPLSCRLLRPISRSPHIVLGVNAALQREAMEEALIKARFSPIASVPAVQREKVHDSVCRGKQGE